MYNEERYRDREDDTDIYGCLQHGVLFYSSHALHHPKNNDDNDNNKFGGYPLTIKCQRL